jgi:hypothetical protein
LLTVITSRKVVDNGIFSDLAQKYIDFDYDRSYPSPEEQLLWRLDDLNYKLEELTEKDAPYRGWKRLTDNDIRYGDENHHSATRSRVN